MAFRTAHVVAMALALAGSAAPLAADTRGLAPGDLQLVRARLRDCPDHLRLLQVARVGDDGLELLGLGAFWVLGKTPGDLLAEIEARYRDRVSAAAIPPISVDRETADARWEALLLMTSIRELECEGFRSDPLRRPVRSRRPILERIAAR